MDEKLSALLIFTAVLSLIAAAPRASTVKDPPPESRRLGTHQARRAGEPASPAQEDTRTPRAGAEVKEDLKRLFAACAAGRHAEAAPYFLYRGPDKKREWVDVYDGDNLSERREVARMCAPVAALLAQSGRAEPVNFSEQVEREGRWRVWEVVFRKGDKRCAVTFALLRAKGRHALGDVDGHLACLRALK